MKNGEGEQGEAGGRRARRDDADRMRCRCKADSQRALKEGFRHGFGASLSSSTGSCTAACMAWEQLGAL